MAFVTVLTGRVDDGFSCLYILIGLYSLGAQRIRLIIQSLLARKLSMRYAFDLSRISGFVSSTSDLKYRR